MTRVMSDGCSLRKVVSEQADQNSTRTHPPPTRRRGRGSTEDSELGCPDKERLRGGTMA